MTTLIPCDSCGKEISKKAPTCPGCGHPNERAKHISPGGVLATLLGAIVFIWWLAPSGGGQLVMDSAADQVAKNAVEQYEIAQRSGDKMQICVHAGFVSAAYMQAKNEASYQSWLAVERRDCKAAGVPQI